MNHDILACIVALSASVAFAACGSTDKPSGFLGQGDDGGSRGDGSAGDDGGNIFGDAGGGDARGGGDPKTCADAEASHSYIGCDYWPTVLANNVWSVFDYAVVVANAGDDVANITVTGPSSTNQKTSVQPGSLVKIYLPWVPVLKGADADSCGSATPLSQSVKASKAAYHLVSDKPVTVYQFSALEYKGQGGPPGKDWNSCPGNQPCSFNGGQPVGCFSFTNDASLLLPSTAMTGNYRVTGYHGWTQANMAAYFAITGTADGTTVTVKVSGTGKVTAGGGVSATGPGGSVTISLDAGDVAEIVGGADDASDLSGSLVHADKPVQVMTGMPCIYIPSAAPACDHIEESSFPAETLGKNYVVATPSGPNGDPVGHLVRIYGNVDGTNLSYAPSRPGSCPASVNAGQVVDCGVVNQDFEVKGDHEFAVGTFMQGATVVDPNNQGAQQKGDPSQSLATAVEQFRKKYIFLAPDDYDVNYVDIVGPAGAAITVDGQGVAGAAPVGGSSFSVLRVKLGAGKSGAHVLQSTLPVGIQVAGYGSFTSYWYPGGLDLSQIAPPPPK